MEYSHLLDNPDDTASRQRLRGLLIAARQINKYAFPTIFNFTFTK
jgi:RNA-directed DNA polymerase